MTLDSREAVARKASIAQTSKKRLLCGTGKAFILASALLLVVAATACTVDESVVDIHFELPSERLVDFPDTARCTPVLEYERSHDHQGSCLYAMCEDGRVSWNGDACVQSPAGSKQLQQTELAEVWKLVDSVDWGSTKQRYFDPCRA
jgi:hypothetical protein